MRLNNDQKQTTGRVFFDRREYSGINRLAETQKKNTGCSEMIETDAQ
jgi:hypothetical protein